jgi:hypothetical protein
VAVLFSILSVAQVNEVAKRGWTISNCYYHTFWTIVKLQGSSGRRDSRSEKLLRIRIFSCIVSRHAWADGVADTLRSVGRVSANERRAVQLFHNRDRATHLALPNESKSSHQDNDRAAELGRPVARETKSPSPRISIWNNSERISRGPPPPPNFWEGEKGKKIKEHLIRFLHIAHSKVTWITKRCVNTGSYTTPFSKDSPYCSNKTASEKIW